MARGRPTKYDPAFCDRVIELGRQGASKAEMALELDIAMSTFDVWQNERADFSEAVKRAVELSRGWWEKKGRIHTFDSKDFNPTSYIFQMKNRFSDHWKDKRETEHSGNLTLGAALDSLDGED